MDVRVLRITNNPENVPLENYNPYFLIHGHYGKLKKYEN